MLEFRSLSQAWNPNPRNWHMSFDPSGTEQPVMRRGERTLVDVYGTLFGEVASILKALNGPEHIHAVRAGDGTIQVDMVRLNLKFFINKDGSVESEEHGAIVDHDQDLGCLYGLTNKLALLDPKGPGHRTVLIPYGQVHPRVEGQHVRIVIIPPEESRIKYFSYSLDAHLQELRDSSGMLGALYLAYLHAVTAFVLPDPATNCSGTDKALRILRQARMKSSFPLDAEAFGLLQNIAALTPWREYYPPHLMVMQTTKWNNNLGEAAQHDDLRPVVQGIINHAKYFRLSMG